MEEVKKYLNSDKDIKQSFFDSSEKERERIAACLQQEITQLIFIAKSRLTGDSAAEVNTYLSLALNKLRQLTFELKPDVTLQPFDLTTALQDLINQRRNIDVDHELINLHELPEKMDIALETAIFRIIQQILNYIHSPDYTSFGIQVIRKGQFIVVKSNFKLNSLENGLAGISILKENLIKAVQVMTYCFDGHFQFLTLPHNHIKFIVYLNEVETL